MISVYIPFCQDLPALKQTLSAHLRFCNPYPVTVCDIGSDPDLKDYLDLHFPTVIHRVSPEGYNLYDWLNHCIEDSITPYAMILSPWVRLEQTLDTFIQAVTPTTFALSPRFKGQVPEDLGLGKWVLGRFCFKNGQSTKNPIGNLTSATEYACLIDVEKWRMLDGFCSLFYSTENPMIDLCYRALKRGWDVGQINAVEATFLPTFSPSFSSKEHRYVQAVTSRLMRLKNNTTPLHHLIQGVSAVWSLLTFRTLENRVTLYTLKLWPAIKAAKKLKQPDLRKDIDLNIKF